jgi:prevent-host-death family protein
MTMVPKEQPGELSVSKSRLKARALEYFRLVERSGRELVITDRGKPVLKLVPYRHDPRDALAVLRDSVVRYDAPAEPVGVEDWKALD